MRGLHKYDEPEVMLKTEAFFASHVASVISLFIVEASDDLKFFGKFFSVAEGFML
jgi:hypothetical protein